MMIVTVLNYLKADEELVEMLNHNPEHHKITAYSSFDKNAYSYIVVKLVPVNLDTMIGQYECEVRIVTDDDLLVEPLTTKVNNLLHFGNKAGFQLKNETLFYSTFTGSSFLFDQEKHVFEQVLIFNMKFKRKG
ncbi:hypothetical protein [Paraliobacillus sp. X-1268]|uniref:hypothetical protein n=1 Tax=Paraliobacillus sp. X-1268 TaxID=2213193 RepID=UPI000E3C21EB|nr:hypothetical protein [Paraliobacillus sp. X-1268]